MEEKFNFFRLIQLFNALKPNEKFSILKISREKQEEILNSIKQNLANLDYINRSFAQYKCQMILYKKINKVILNFVSFTLFFPILTFLLLNGLLILALNGCELFFKKLNFKKSNVAVFFGIDENRISESLLKNYRFVRINPNFALDFKTLVFLLSKIYFRFFLHPYFCLRNTIKVSLYNANLLIFQPKVFVVTSEYSFTSSILTYYCEINNCEHINIMHGEKLFYIRDSFFKFHKCYVWHKHYVNLFEKLGADKNQFIVELHSFFNPREILYKNKEKYNEKKNLKYYVGGETKKQLYQLCEFLALLSKTLSIVIRPHPFGLNTKEIDKIFSGFEIENPKNIPIIDSLISADFICALYSTVLFQGYCLGKKIVVNDLDKNIYEKLRELDFIIFKLPHSRLSQILTQINNLDRSIS